MLKRDIYKELFNTTGNAPQRGAHKADKYCKLILPDEHKNKLHSNIQFIWCIHMDGEERGSENKWSNLYDKSTGLIKEKCNKLIKKDQYGYRLVINWKETDYEILGIAKFDRYDENKNIRIFELISRDKNCFVLKKSDKQN